MRVRYRFYLLDCFNHIANVEVIECDHDAEARRRADTMLVNRPQYHGVEVWDFDRRVYFNVVGVESAAASD